MQSVPSAPGAHIGTVFGMDDRTYGLTELARLAHVRKARLLELLQDGTLVGSQIDGGRREWRIKHSDAVAAGLYPEVEQSVDSAIRACVAAELRPLTDAVSAHHQEVLARLESIEATQRERSPSSDMASVGGGLLAGLRRWLRWLSSGPLNRERG